MEQMVNGVLPWSDGSGGYCYSPYNDLAAAIIMQAVKDYISVIRQMWDPKVSRAEKRKTILEKLELENFFHSDWYEALSDVDPDKVIYNCRLRAEEQEKEAIRKQNKQKKKELLKKATGKDGISQ